MKTILLFCILILGCSPETNPTPHPVLDKKWLLITPTDDFIVTLPFCEPNFISAKYVDKKIIVSGDYTLVEYNEKGIK
jgi:hypothetical protein